MAASRVLSLLSLSLSFSLISAEDTFTVTEPKAGDTVSIGRTTTANVEVPITWTVPDTIANRPVLISLVQGNNLSSLTQIEQIDPGAPNNGSYTWRGENFDSSLVYNYGYGAPSGCNYSVELKVWTDVVYSGYFAIINPKDGGLSADAVCPGEGEGLGVENRTVTGSSTSEGEGEVAGTSEGEASRTGEASNSSGTEGGSNSGGGGISTTTLAVAVAVPIVVLLIAFGMILWLGIRRGWFVRKGSQEGRNSTAVEKGDVVIHSKDDKEFGGGNEPAMLSVRELHANDRPHQLESSAVHELQGGDGGQNYVVRN